MKNKKIIDAWDEISLSEERKNIIFENIQQKLQPQKKPPAFKLTPALITAAIFIMLVTTAAAVAPHIINLNLTANITQDNINYIAGLEHNITIDSVSISPDGNFLTITEKAGTGELNRELFCNFFVIDDSGNSYTLAELHIDSRRNWEEDITYTVEFCGNIPADAQYLKVIPYNYNPISELIADPNGVKPWEEGFITPDWLDPNELYLESKAYISDLPYSFRQSEYGNVLIESCDVTDKDITLTYKCEGMVKPPLLSITDGKNSISPYGQLSFTNPVYDRDTDSYALVFKINKPNKPIETAKGLKVIQYDIDLLEDQAIIIPLK